MSGRIYVNEKGYASDDENRSWFVGTSFPPGDYDLRDLPKPPTQRVEVQHSDKRDADFVKLILAASANGDERGAKFLLDMRFKQALSEKQTLYLNSVVKLHRALALKLPLVQLERFTDPDALEVKDLSQHEAAGLDPYFSIEERSGKKVLVSEKIHPSQRDLNKPSLEEQQIEAINRHNYKTGGSGFLISLKSQLKRGKILSPKQNERAREMFLDLNMTEDAKLFAANPLRKAAPNYLEEFGTDSELYRLVSAYARREKVAIPEAYRQLQIRAGQEAEGYDSFLDWIESH